eukprot:g6373.t1
MPGPSERHEHGKGPGPAHEGGPPGHGKHGHEGGGGPRPGRRGGKRGARGKKRPGDDDDSSDEDESEPDCDDDCCDDEEEEKFPGVRKAGRVAGRKWKRENGISVKTKDMTDKQKEQIRAAKREARIAFRQAARKAER